MLDLVLKAPQHATARILCLGAHCDDIEIGCGGALLHLQESASVQIDWVVCSGTQQRREETRAAMLKLVAPQARGDLILGDFRDGFFPSSHEQLKDFIESVKRRVPPPDLILCHERDDRHQDHRMVNELVWNTFRDHVVLEYEIPKWDGGLGQPNLYVPVTEAQARSKVTALLESHHSQLQKDWFNTETFMALLRLRGIESRSPSGYAEGFHARKLRFVGF
jgi:LmbE family N-acetylglucosaminyl deacetylase